MPRKTQTEETPEVEEITSAPDLELSDSLEEEPMVTEVSESMESPDSALDQDRAVRLIESIENDLRALRQILTGTMAPRVDHALNIASIPVGFMQNSHDAGIDGYFDGEKMIDTEGKTYQVPPNYASKSKLVEGDPLKLYITRDGKYVFKQLGPVERITVPGTLRMEGNHYIVDADDGESYNVLTACVTYYMSLYGLQAGGRVMALLPGDRKARWAVIDNIL